jgi:hypothetical protein
MRLAATETGEAHPMKTYQLIDPTLRHGTLCVRLKKIRPEEPELDVITDEILDAQAEAGCPKVALSLGPDKPVLLYSVFLAKLVTLKRLLQERGCTFFLCELAPALRQIFTATALETHFIFVKDFDEAILHGTSS